MICPNPECKRIISTFDETCKHCGTSLKSNPVRDYERKAEEIVKGAGLRAEEIRAEIRSEFEKSEGLKHSGRSSHGSVLGSFGAKMASGSAVDRSSKQGIDTESLHRVLSKEKKGSKLNELFGIVRYNPHVTENPVFNSLAENVRFFYDDENMGVNAFADIFKGRPVIAVYDGYLNFMLAVDAIFAAKKLDRLITLGERYLGSNYKFSLYELACVIDDLPTDAKNFENPYISCFETIAHEMGHVCYSHIFSPGYSNMTADESRNMERDADSFASSVINRSIFGREMFIAHLKCCISWTVVEKVGGRVEPKTHPLASERLINAVKSNSALASQVGIDEEFVLRLLQ